MPLYAYACPVCGQRFEKLIPLARRDEPVVCESCGHEEVRRSVDSFRAALGAGTGSSGSSSSSSSSCGRGGFT